MASMFLGRPEIDLSDDLRAAETQHYGHGQTGWAARRRAEQAATAKRESELRSRLESLGASTSGRKTTLVKRLLDAERARLPTAPPPANAREAFLTAFPRASACLPVQSAIRLASIVSKQTLKLARGRAIDALLLPTKIM